MCSSWGQPWGEEAGSAELGSGLSETLPQGEGLFVSLFRHLCKEPPLTSIEAFTGCNAQPPLAVCAFIHSTNVS